MKAQRENPVPNLAFRIEKKKKKKVKLTVSYNDLSQQLSTTDFLVITNNSAGRLDVQIKVAGDLRMLVWLNDLVIVK